MDIFEELSDSMCSYYFLSMYVERLFTPPLVCGCSEQQSTRLGSDVVE